MEASKRASFELDRARKEEYETSEAERGSLLQQIRVLVEESGQNQLNRLGKKCDYIRAGVMASSDSLENATAQHDRQVDEYIFKHEQFAKDVSASKEGIYSRMQNDWEVRPDLT